MALRIVVSFRGIVPSQGSEAYFKRALSIKKQAEALGGTLCAWSAQTFSFDFEPDALEEAVALAACAHEGDDAEIRFSAGMAEGEMSPLGEGGSLAALSWGPPLVASVALSRDARFGEVLLDAALCKKHSAALAELGFCTAPDGGRWVLRPSPIAAPPPPSPPPPSPAPEVVEEIEEIEEIEAVEDDDDFAELVFSARTALLQRDLPELERALAQMRVMGERERLVERLSGLFALLRGDVHEAVRRLWQEVDLTTEAAQKPQARLAYAVALSVGGHMQAALIEALEALACARQNADTRGERACARMLSLISSAAGDAQAASAWAFVAERAAAPG